MPQEKTYSQMRNEFTERFYKQIVPKIQNHEKERKATFFFAIVCSMPFIIVAILAFFTYNKIDFDTFMILLTLYVFASGVFCFIKKRFENSIKPQIMPIVCSCFTNTNLKWSTKEPYIDILPTFIDNLPSFIGYKETEYLDPYVCPVCFQTHYDDMFEGCFKEIKFEIVEMGCIRKYGKGKEDAFSGVIVKLDMNKEFTGCTVIKPETLIHHSPSAKLKRTELEDIVFEKKFDVFTDDEVEARYLITPSFMERLNEMKVAFTADKVSCAFYEKSLFVALSTKKDLFSICSLFKKIDDPKQFFTMFEEILSIIKLIDHFKLNQKIGL